MNWLEVDPFEWSKVKYFAIYVLAFSGGTWSNMKVNICLDSLHLEFNVRVYVSLGQKGCTTTYTKQKKYKQ